LFNTFINFTFIGKLTVRVVVWAPAEIATGATGRVTSRPPHFLDNRLTDGCEVVPAGFIYILSEISDGFVSNYDQFYSTLNLRTN
jgi:hypothetical protein